MRYMHLALKPLLEIVFSFLLEFRGFLVAKVITFLALQKKKEKTINPVIVLRFSTHAKGVNKKLAHNQRVIFKTSIFSPIFIFFVFA